MSVAAAARISLAEEPDKGQAAKVLDNLRHRLPQALQKRLADIVNKAAAPLAKRQRVTVESQLQAAIGDTASTGSAGP